MKNTTERFLAGFFAGAILLGTVALSLPGMTAGPLSFVDRLFTATSAVCVTGLTVVDTGTSFTIPGQLVILLLIQVGGLGYMTIGSIAVVLFGRLPLGQKGVISESLNVADLPAAQQLKLVMKQVLVYTLLFESAGALLLGMRFSLDTGSVLRGVYLGVFHAVSAFCNAGFSLFPDSLERFRADVLVNVAVSALVIAGGLGYVVWINLRRRILRRGELLLHTKIALTATGVLLAVGYAAVWLANPRLIAGMDPVSRVLVPWFTAMTARTAGFNTVPMRDLSSLTLLVLMVLMFIGASPGGTGGGIKTTTAAVMVLFLSRFMHREGSVPVFRRMLSQQLVLKSFTIFLLSLVVVLCAAVLIHAVSGCTLGVALFETVSAFGTVGLSLGLTPALPTAGKLVLLVVMVAGRVGVLTLLLAMVRRRVREIHYIEEDVAIG
jgi:trk system potassium uptake protein TrkH